jgi:hypothetical protein
MYRPLISRHRQRKVYPRCGDDLINQYPSEVIVLGNAGIEHSFRKNVQDELGQERGDPQRFDAARHA